jgi:RNA polymerase sigma-54 factor
MIQKQSLSTNVTTSTTIGPHIQQALKLLQLSSLELLDKIDAELAENPFLEQTYDDYKQEKTDSSQEDINKLSPLDAGLDKSVTKSENSSESIEDIFEDSSDFGYMKKNNERRGDANSKQLFLENAVAVERSLYDNLIDQLSLCDAPDDIREIAEAIISGLNDEGYFKIDIKEFAKSINISLDDAYDGLDLVQSLEPAGVGARNLQECLLIQIANMTNPDIILIEIIRDNFNLLEKKKFKELSAKLNISQEKLKDHYMKIIAGLEPIPARQFDTKKIKYIVPDIIIQRVETGFTIAINDDYMPNLKINSFYKKVLKTETLSNEVKTFLTNKYSDARLLILSLSKRKSTIYKVMEKILELQMEFFIGGPQHLKPLTLNDVAEEVGMHMSTISRVTRDKYVDTPWGIFELKYFFSNSIKKTGGGDKSARSVKELIKQIIENESDGKKLSDQKISDILSNRGIKIARRTVAKYRKKLKIFSSYDRKD